MTISTLNNIDRVNLLLDDAYLRRNSNLPESIEIAKEALQISKHIEDKASIGRSLNQLSLYYMINSEFEKSKDHSREAIECFTLLKDERGVANANYNIGSVHYKTNNYHIGLTYLIKALKVYRKHNDLYNQSKVEKAVGSIYEYIGDTYNAFKSYKSSILAARKISNLNLESNVYNNLSGLLLKKKLNKFAMRSIEHSIGIKKETKDIRGYGFSIYGRGKVYFAAGEYEKSESDFLEAIAIHKEVGENIGVAMGLRKLGKLYFSLGHLEKAEEAIKEGLNLSIRFQMAMIKIKNYHLLYLINKKKNDTEKALKYLEIYLEEKEAVINTQTLKVIEDYDLINKMNALENEALLQKIKQKSIDKKNRAEQRSMRIKQQFLSIMSHEIRTPLNAITTIISILDDKVKEENKELLQSLEFASNNLINIVNDILDFTKLDSKKSKLELYNSNLGELCGKVINLHSNLAKDKGLDLVMENNIPKDRGYLIDQTKISQILTNLIGNAIKFTEKGSVGFNVELLDEGESHDTIKFTVSDTGEGISEQDLVEIFESFTQVKPILTRKQGGTGLGLAIVKRLVELHNSEIKVKSREHEGSEFYFILKLEKGEKIVLTKKNSYLELKDKHVLLAEDTPINSMLLKKLLSNWGIITDHVVNGKEAVEFAKNKKYDFILMDIHMPEMDGLDATRLIRTVDNFNRDTPVFAVTADVMASENKSDLKLFNGILWKPIEIEKLYSTLAKTIKN